jgi:hypothetical protein
MKRKLIGIVLLLIALVGVAFVVARNTRQQICVVTLAPIEQVENASEQLEPMKCFDNLADLAAYQTNGAVQLPRDVSEQDYIIAMREWERQRLDEFGTPYGQ